MEQKEPIIRLEHLVKEFKTSSGTVKALEDISLDIYAGEIFGIIGLSGAGKSTLVRCINYLEVPTSGEVIFEGVPMGSLDRKGINQARRSMGMIFQQFNLLAQRNILKNVCFPMELQKTPKDQAEKRARELLEMVGLADREKAYPAQLSGGQKQRVAIIDKSHIAEVGEVSQIFSGPKSAIGRQLIMGDTVHADFGDSKLVRITFDGRASNEPVLANLILACKVPVNIMYAATKDVNGTALGQMIIQLPKDEGESHRVMNYLATAGIPHEEVTRDDF